MLAQELAYGTVRVIFRGRDEFCGCYRESVTSRTVTLRNLNNWNLMISTI